MWRASRKFIAISLVACHCAAAAAMTDSSLSSSQVWSLLKTSLIYADAKQGVRIEHMPETRALQDRQLTVSGIVGWSDPEQPTHFALVGFWDWTGCPCDLGDPMKVIDVQSTHPAPEMGITVQVTGRFAIGNRFDGNGWIFRLQDAGPFTPVY